MNGCSSGLTSLTSASVASALIGFFALRSQPRTVTFFTWRASEIVGLKLTSDLPRSSLYVRSAMRLDGPK